MNDEIKTIRDFCSIRDIDEIIECWVKESRFIESILPKQQNPDDIAYCFSLNEGNARTLLTINILDDKVHLEAWVTESICHKEMSKTEINNLLKRLGQELMNV